MSNYSKYYNADKIQTVVVLDKQTAGHPNFLVLNKSWLIKRNRKWLSLLRRDFKMN